jgi:hypothetical protein
MVERWLDRLTLTHTGLLPISAHPPPIRCRFPQTALVADRLRHRAHDPGRLRQALPLFRQASQAAKQHFERADWATGPAGRARAHRFLRQARAGMRADAGRRIRARGADRRSLARTQAALHRPAVRPQAAGAGRDLLQLGLLQHPAPQLLTTTISSSCARPSRPSTSRPRNRADLPRLLSRHRRPALHAQAHRHQLPAGRPLRRPRSRRRAGRSAPGRRSSAPTASSRTSRSTCCRACSSATRAPTSSAAASTATREYPFVVPILHNRHGELVLDTVLTDPSRSPSCSRSRAPTSGRHGSALGLRAVPAQPAAAQAAQRDLHHARPAKAGQDAVLPRLPAAPEAQLRPVPHRARHPRPGDAGVRAAVLPVCVQGDQGFLSRRRRTPRARRSRKNTCW